MKIAIAGFHLESASFLPQECSVADFEANTTRAADIIQSYETTNTVPGGFIKTCQEAGAEIIPLTYSYLGALGPATDAAIAGFAEEIAKAAAEAQPNGVLLHLHGATWAPGYRDSEKHFIDELRRRIGAVTPIVVCFDYHGNIDQDTVANADAAFAYHKSPHVDMADTGRRGAECLLRILTRGEWPGLAVAKPGLIVPSIFSATALHPLADIIFEAREREVDTEHYLDISIMAGFSYADSHNTGFAVVVVSGAGPEDAEAVAAEFSENIQRQRAALYRPETVLDVATAVDRACAEAPGRDKPIVLLEHADRMNDSTYLLAELVQRDAQRAAVPFLWDSDAAMAAHRAGPGARLTLELGAWSSDKAGPRQSYECDVLQTGAKSYRISGAMLQGQKVDLGMTALLRIGGVTVSVVSNFAFTVDEDVFKVFGQDISDYDIIVLRSKTHFRQYYETAASQIFLVDTPDHGPADLTLIPYRNLDTTKVYPLNALVQSREVGP